jgi:hypothetical protein
MAPVMKGLSFAAVALTALVSPCAPSDPCKHKEVAAGVQIIFSAA